jgi:hypothetical protein
MSKSARRSRRGSRLFPPVAIALDAVLPLTKLGVVDMEIAPFEEEAPIEIHAA